MEQPLVHPPPPRVISEKLAQSDRHQPRLGRGSDPLGFQADCRRRHLAGRSTTVHPQCSGVSSSGGGRLGGAPTEGFSKGSSQGRCEEALESSYSSISCRDKKGSKPGRIPGWNYAEDCMVRRSSVLGYGPAATERHLMVSQEEGARHSVDGGKDGSFQAGYRGSDPARPPNLEGVKGVDESKPRGPDLGTCLETLFPNSTAESEQEPHHTFHSKGSPNCNGVGWSDNRAADGRIATPFCGSTAEIHSKWRDMGDAGKGEPHEFSRALTHLPVFGVSAPRNPLSIDQQIGPWSDPGEEGGAPDLILPYGRDLSVVSSGTALRPPNNRTLLGELDSLTSSRLNLNVLETMDDSGILEGVLSLITNRASFNSTFLPGSSNSLRHPRTRRGTSRRMRHHADTLEKWNIITKCNHVEVVLPLFTVPKSNGLLRPVVDGRKLNVLQEKPPSMKLPTIQEVITFITKNRWFMQYDGRSWFYQFEIHPEIRGFFGLHLAGPRGDFQRYCLNVLPMGWSYAPSIAQRASLVLVSGLQATAWVDNFLFASETKDDLLKNDTMFRVRCEKANAELKEAQDHGVPLQRFVALGIDFDLASETQRHRISDKWRRSFLEKQELRLILGGGLVTTRCFYKVMGAVVWYSYVTSSPLCKYSAVLAFFRSVAQQVANYDVGAYDEPITIPVTVRDEVRVAAERISHNPWIHRKVMERSWNLWSDASSVRWAAFIASGDSEVYGQGNFTDVCPEHIFFKELLAAYQVLVQALSMAPPRTQMNIFIDNLPVVKSIQKGHSSATVANTILTSLFDAADGRASKINPVWVPTDVQKADVYTRTELVPPGDGFDHRLLHHCLTLWGEKG
eukprot:TRINITY_DN3752_c0_g1_i1.p1 TRINITY_DN3752_c0_g1~~TRINITY_DN3752_c0_g1_i1.p1  ORF type:complete len:848 (+),score=32.91 TRINITY_DN3752_c0_g1_i1:2262-4805(+)